MKILQRIQDTSQIYILESVIYSRAQLFDMDTRWYRQDYIVEMKIANIEELIPINLRLDFAPLGGTPMQVVFKNK